MTKITTRFRRLIPVMMAAALTVACLASCTAPKKYGCPSSVSITGLSGSW